VVYITHRELKDSSFDHAKPHSTCSICNPKLEDAFLQDAFLQDPIPQSLEMYTRWHGGLGNTLFCEQHA
jgi:hypothetical protein